MTVLRSLFFIGIAACSDPLPEAMRVDGLIRHGTLYSAYDGEHDYQVVVTLKPELVTTDNPATQVDWASVRWATDSAFVDQEAYPELEGAALLTTKRSGTTRIGVSFETTEHVHFRGETTLVISEARSDEWRAGDARFSLGEQIVPPPPEAYGACGLPREVVLPITKACVNCHNPEHSPLGSPCTPLDTAAYPDDELIAVFTGGALPRDGVHNEAISQWEHSGADGTCIFMQMHPGDRLDDHLTRGLLWKLRSLRPVVPQGFDPSLLADEPR